MKPTTFPKLILATMIFLVIAWTAAIALDMAAGDYRGIAIGGVGLTLAVTGTIMVVRKLRPSRALRILRRYDRHPAWSVAMRVNQDGDLVIETEIITRIPAPGLSHADRHRMTQLGFTAEIADN